jgi:hypothetical protein
MKWFIWPIKKELFRIDRKFVEIRSHLCPSPYSSAALSFIGRILLLRFKLRFRGKETTSLTMLDDFKGKYHKKRFFYLARRNKLQN